MALVEVDRPGRTGRCWQGTSDPVDAEAAARAALARVRAGLPRQRDGQVEALEALRVARRSAVTHRAEVVCWLKALVVTAPEPLGQQPRPAHPPAAASAAAFALLCGVAPPPASAKTTRHRRNRGGDRHATSAL